jgi:hypothetical protein
MACCVPVAVADSQQRDMALAPAAIVAMIALNEAESCPPGFLCCNPMSTQLNTLGPVCQAGFCPSGSNPL